MEQAVKDGIINRIVKDSGIPENIVESVITFQFKDAHEATKEHNSIEFSGWGKFTIVDYKVANRIKRCNFYLDKFEKELALNPTIKLQKTVEGIKKDLVFYESKLNRT